jgi:hypothetical protein
MFELLFCPEHGLPRLIMLLLGGVDLQFLFLTIRLWFGKVRS